MKVLVCVKQVPDPTAPAALDAATHLLQRDGVTLVLDPGDEYGIEAGLQLAEADEGEVVLISMGPESGKDALRKGLGMGAVKGILISDDRLRGADALTTAHVLAAAIRKEQFDVVITATESTDGYTGVMPQMLAALLHVPALTFAKSTTISGTEVRITRQTETGSEEVHAPLPLVISVTAGANEPRYPTLKGIMTAKSKPIDVWTLDELGVGAPQVDQHVDSVEPVAARGAGELITDDGTAAHKIVEFLATVKVV